MATIYKNYASEALQVLQAALKDVAPKIYFDVRPSTVSEQMKSFVVIAANNRWNELNVVQYTLMSVNLFHRVRQGNVLPIDKTQEMVDKVLEKLPFIEGRFKFHDPIVIRICKSDDLGFGYATIQVRCEVNTTDKFN